MVVVEIWRDMPHVFQTFSFLPESQQALGNEDVQRPHEPAAFD